MKIRAILVIRVPRRDGGAVSYTVMGIAELCDLCVLCGELIQSIAPQIPLRECICVRIYNILVRVIKHSYTYIKVGREGNKHCVWDPFPEINLLPSHPLNTRISTFWTYINVPQITRELV